MDFTLVYWGTTLKASNRRTGHAWEKHQIRLNFSEQLENLWSLNTNLHHFDPRGQIRDAHAKSFGRCGVEFVPLVLRKWNLICELDIIFLRAGDPGNILFDGGRIDNRIKTLIDALRVPSDRNEMPLRNPETDPKRIYCLLEDDKLVTSLKVSTSRLLVSKAGKEDEACLLI